MYSRGTLLSQEMQNIPIPLIFLDLFLFFSLVNLNVSTLVELSKFIPRVRV